MARMMLMSVWTPEWWEWPGGRITLATRGNPAIQCGNMELRIMYIMLNLTIGFDILP
jgi:hypothetical protein